jgi:hypothetical protein
VGKPYVPQTQLTATKSQTIKSSMVNNDSDKENPTTSPEVGLKESLQEKMTKLI